MFPSGRALIKYVLVKYDEQMAQSLLKIDLPIVYDNTKIVRIPLE